MNNTTFQEVVGGDIGMGLSAGLGKSYPLQEDGSFDTTKESVQGTLGPDINLLPPASMYVTESETEVTEVIIDLKERYGIKIVKHEGGS